MATSFAEMVEAELKRARQKHAPIHSPHEGYAVLLEEVEEVKKEVFWGERGGLLLELVQVAAMAQRMAEDCEL